MIGRIVEVAENGRHLSSCSENAVNPQRGTVPNGLAA